MTGRYRTPSGGRIDRSRILRFTFDGRSYEGLQGDTLASALMANGVHVVGRSFKYHRPRGILAAGVEEPNALVTIDRGQGRVTPNTRATVTELYDGLAATSQNRWPSLAYDFGSIADRVSPLLPAGFYYKTFLWPPAFWHRLYEPIIRRGGGLGSAPAAADPDRYQQRFAHCDVLVVGAGPAGLAAALAASSDGARVVVADEQAEMGGSLLAEMDATIDGKPAALWIADTLATLAARPHVRLLPRTTAFAYLHDNMLGLVERVTDHLAAPHTALPRERLWQVRAREVVLAAGALERPLVFPDNDRPGILMAEAARTYVNRYGVAPGSRAVLVTASDMAYRALADLRRVGVEVPLTADVRTTVPPTAARIARTLGIEVLAGASVVGTRGRHRVSGVHVMHAGRRFTIACDTVLMSAGATPTVHLFSQSRGRLVLDEASGALVPGAPAERTWVAGACRGVTDLATVLDDGAAAGRNAARRATGREGPARTYRVSGIEEFAATAAAPPAAPDATEGMAFVDFQNDVTARDIALAAREGFRSIEHIKRYTTTGTGTDQGKTSNASMTAIAADAFGTSIAAVGHTTYRLPYTPVTFGALAGAARGPLLEPVRTTPLHDEAVALGAVFENVGAWKRAHYFPRSGEIMPAAVARECTSVRTCVGLTDASTLGKIEMAGPDAARFVELIYTGYWPRLAPGQCRYALVLKDDGFVFDDGIVARLSADRFHVTTTTGGAARVLHHMEDYRQTEWPHLKVWLTSVTEHWAVIAVQGPKSREILERHVEGIDLATTAMPYMSVRTGRICGVPTRLFRVGFTGELGYEVNVPAAMAPAVWRTLLAEAIRCGGGAYGTEAMHVLRAEKGYVLVGQETDGTVTADDLGLGAMVGHAKPDFVGKRGLARADLVASGRRQLVGLLTEDPALVLEEGAQVTMSAVPVIGSHVAGYVTSSYMSPTLGRSIALALIERGRALKGERVFVPLPGRVVPAIVTASVFYDPEGARLRA